MTCHYQDLCRMLPYLRRQEDHKPLLATYCDGPGHRDCERYKLKSAQMLVPLDLLPDGSVVDSQT
jgi:hypothetical protein